MISTFQKRKKKVNFSAAKNVSESEYESTEDSSASSEEVEEPEKDNGSEKEEGSENEFSDDEYEEIEVDDEDEMRRRIERGRENMKYLMQNFSESQLQRYETFRRAGLQRSVMKKVMQNILGQTVNPNAVIVCAGVAKVFVGELIEKAREIMEEWGESGALLPSHIREAHRRMKKNTQVPPNSLYRKKLKL